MSMDFSCYVVFMPPPQEPDWAAGDAAVSALARTHPKDWPEEFRDYYDGELGACGEDLNSMSDETGARRAEEAAAVLRADLACVKEGWGCDRNDAAVFDLPGLRVLISGGWSDGDPPTDAAAAISRLECAGVLVACGFNREPAPDEAAVQSLVSEIEAAGKDRPCDLDELVQDAKGEEAAAISNAGPEAQVHYLTHGGTNVEWLRQRLGLDERKECQRQPHEPGI